MTGQVQQSRGPGEARTVAQGDAAGSVGGPGQPSPSLSRGRPAWLAAPLPGPAPAVMGTCQCCAVTVQKLFTSFGQGSFPVLWALQIP